MYFEWFAHGIGKRAGGFRPLVYDAASAFLMAFEGTLQVLGEEKFDGKRVASRLERWLEPQEAYGMVCSALRTMRHSDAHLLPAKLDVQCAKKPYSIFDGAVQRLGGRAARST